VVLAHVNKCNELKQKLQLFFTLVTLMGDRIKGLLES